MLERVSSEKSLLVHFLLQKPCYRPVLRAFTSYSEGKHLKKRFKDLFVSNSISLSHQPVILLQKYTFTLLLRKSPHFLQKQTT